MSFSKTIQMYIFDGNPNSRIMCELSNWNGKVYKISRSELSKFSDRPDAENTGVYFLLGKNETNEDVIYIGEAENIYSRLKQHITKDFWNDIIAVISKDNILNKAHVKYLENKFYNLAIQAGRSAVVNTQTPVCSSVSEYDCAMLEEFISNTKLLVNALGYKVFDTINDGFTSPQNKVQTFSITSQKGTNATGCVVPDGFVVFKGSTIANTTTPSIPPSINKHRTDLIDKGIVNSNFELTKDQIFTSSSLAASVVLGRSSNGRTSWKTADNKTLKDIEEADL